MDYIVNGVAKSRTQLSNFHFNFHFTSLLPHLHMQAHLSASISSLIHHEVGRTVTPISQVWKLRHRGEKCSEFLAGCREMSLL